MLMLDAQRVASLCSKGVTFMLHHASMKEMFPLILLLKRKLRLIVILARLLQNECLVMKTITQAQQKRVRLAKSSCMMLKPSLKSLFLVRQQFVKDNSRPAQSPDLSSLCLYHFGVILDYFAPMLFPMHEIKSK